MKQINITELDAHQTSFKYVKKYLNNAPLSFIEKLFRKKDIKVNGHWVNKNYLLKANDVLQIYIKDEQLDEFNKRTISLPVDFALSIIYEDKNILIINKPKGLLVHEDQKEKRRTLSNAVIAYLTKKNEYNPINVNGFTPAPCHRLDRNTSGLIVFAKNMEALQIMEELFKEKTSLDKYYITLVNGHIDKDGTINLPLKKDASSGLVKVAKDGKTAISEYSVIHQYQDYTLVKVHLITGRTHQIRVHFASINHPIIGDNKYGNFLANKIFKNKYQYDSQFLHASTLKFGQIKGILNYLSNKCFEVDLAKKEKSILSSLK